MVSTSCFFDFENVLSRLFFELMLVLDEWVLLGLGAGRRYPSLWRASI
jgi:hypothetical protein